MVETTSGGKQTSGGKNSGGKNSGGKNSGGKHTSHIQTNLIPRIYPAVFINSDVMQSYWVL